MIDKELLLKYFRKECSPEEEKEVLSYLSGTDHQALEALMEASWDGLPKEEIDSVTTQRMLSNLAANTYDGAHKASKRTANIRWLLPRSIAASVLIFFTSYFLWSHYSKQQRGASPGTASPLIVMNNTIDTVNNTDKTINLALSDSSKVTLYPKSRLRYFTNIATIDKRELHLDGKALFDVAKNQNKPFTVYTGIISTTALGTSFTVNSIMAWWM